MATVGIEQHESGASTLDEIRRAAELRLREIEPLIEEAERLRGVLRALEERPEGAHRPGAAHPPDKRRPSSSAPARRGAPQRAAKGANKRAIIELVAERPGITPAEIAATTGMKRTVVASTVSRLKRHGELCDNEGGGLRSPATAETVETSASRGTSAGRLASLPRRRAA